MESELLYITQSQINPNIRKLEAFLSDKNFKTPKGNANTNIVDQLKGDTYNIPSVRVENNITDYEDSIIKSYNSPIDEFFYLLEECRKTNVILHFSELQYYQIKKNVVIESEEPEESEKIEESNIFIDKSGIDLDFDIYQKNDTRTISDVHFYQLVDNISKLIMKTIDIDSCNDIKGIIEGSGNNKSLVFYAVILIKPDIVELNHGDYGRCYKESFRVRIPGIKITKEYKKYLINLILEKDILTNIFHGMQILNPFSNVLDSMSSTHPLMFLGSAKRGKKVAHVFYKLYKVIIRPYSDMIQVLPDCKDFDEVKQNAYTVKLKDPLDGRKKIVKTVPPKYRYNLCYELSVHFEDPSGLIKKREFNPKPEIETEIKTHIERSSGNIICQNELQETRNNVTDLIVRDPDAEYLKKILEIISPDRVKTYDSWRWIIYILAWTNSDYKPLAIWFSYRFPNSWAKGGLGQLETNWQWALDHKSEESGENNRTINTIYSWAKEDNPDKYKEIQEFNTFIALQKLLIQNSGKLNESHCAIILKKRYGNRFVCDENPNSNSSVRRWYEFVFPDGDVGRVKNSIYKWRREKGKPDTLDKYITKKLPEYITRVKDWVASKIEEQNAAEDSQKYYELVKKNIDKTIFSMGTELVVNRILSRCEVEFRDRGFEELLDTDPNVIGTGNGVLKVYPKIEMIQRYHEIPITRSTNVDYVKYNPNNPYIKELETEIRRLFADEEDAYIKTMCYLASSLDGRKRSPLFYIWLGEGSNGKSFLLELHIGTLKEVVKNGYGAKINVAFFTQTRQSGGPDSEKMMLKHARFAYCSESEAGDTLQMAKIKEFTSETISGNEKHQTQDMFEANCHFVFCSNNDPRVTGRDYGTWRRIMIYRFKIKFVPNPDPKNKYEYKEDKKFVDIIPKDTHYKEAYLSILVKFYEIFRDKYNGDLNNIISKSIENDTRNYRNEQDTVSRFISEQVIYIGPVFKRKNLETNEYEPVPNIPITDLASKYIIWHTAKIDDKKPIRSEVIKQLTSSSLKKFMVDRFTGLHLSQHIILNLGEDPDEEKPNQNKESKKIEDETHELIDDLDDQENNQENEQNDQENEQENEQKEINFPKIINNIEDDYQEYECQDDHQEDEYQEDEYQDLDDYL